MPNSAETPRTPSRSRSSSHNPPQDHVLPSVEFTFSYSPSSTGRLTPTSSIDDSVNHEINQRSITPTTHSLFQNLHLSESPRHATSESESPPSNSQRVSGLTPTSHQTTYRDLYNATPIPEGAPATERQSRSQTPTSPLGAVTSHVQNLNLADSDSDSSPESWNDNGDDGDDDNDHLYNVREEELPQAPIYDIRLQNSLRNVRGQLAGLAQCMSGRELVRNPRSTFYELYEQTLGASRFAYPTTRTVGFIGDSGMGKSSVINSILDEDGLARSSGDGVGCTTVVTEFRNVNEEYPENYTVKADFMDNGEIRELLEELLSNVRRYYTDAYRGVTELEEQEKIKTAANRALDTLRSLFPSQPELAVEFLSRDGEDAAESIVSTLEERAIAGLDNRPGGRDRLEEPRVARHAEECMELLDSLMVDPRGDDRMALWPFVRLIRVYLRSPILRTGLVLADLPGFRDLNYARVRATERYLRHSCDEVFIVTTITRCTSDQSISDIIHRCAQDQPIQIVCTRSEDVDARETARTAAAAEATQIRNLDNRIQGLDRRIRHIRARRQQATGRRSQTLAAEQTNLSDQREVAELELKRFLISRRNQRVTNDLMRVWGNRARVFCVSNTLYSDHRAQDPDQANAYLELSGIRDLRRYCQSVPAAAQLRATEVFLRDEVPALLGSVSVWAAAGSDTITQSRAEVLRGALNEAEQTLQQSITSHGSEVRLLQSSLERQFRDTIRQTIRNSRNNWRDHAVAASRDWAIWHHSTYAAWCRHNGTYQTKAQAYRCWNEEVLGLGRIQLPARWDTMLDLLEEQKVELGEKVSRLFQSICDSIEEHHDIAPDTMRILLRNLATRQRCIIHAIDSALDDLDDETDKIKLDTIGGHDSSYIAGVMRPVYISCREQSGTGSDSRRKQTMNRHLTSSPLFATFSNKITADYGELIERTFNLLDQKLRGEVGNITRDLRASVTVEGDVSEAGQDPGHTEEVKRRVGVIEEALGQAQRVVTEVGRAAVESE
ncbi:hypothetical protein BDW59DRAFT_142167 [Aspergillus cavernicola]|uniref:P-loop containing nucleoside triphosphate hydrolase protein n=1 Tax=Aspergillus cavernicola TaxID=176166 RepID=A0ABR4IP31_9EURO